MKKVLIIDDDADLREVIRMALEDTYEVKEAGNGEEGFKILEAYTPDVILLDVMMETTTTGFHMCRELKTRSSLQGTKIIMITSVDQELEIDFKSEAGDPDWLPVDDYITKPIHPRTLREKIEAVVA